MRSAPQKQPIPTTACWSPSGKGGAIGVSSTSCRAGTGIASSRPGCASAAETIVLDFVKRNMPVSLPTGLNVTRRLSRAGSADEELPRALAGRLRADPLRALDPPVAVAAEHHDVPRR